MLYMEHIRRVGSLVYIADTWICSFECIYVCRFQARLVLILIRIKLALSIVITLPSDPVWTIQSVSVPVSSASPRD